MDSSRRKSKRVGRVFLVVMLGSGVLGHAAAEDKNKKSAKPAAAVNATALTVKLKSGDPAVIQSALSEAKSAGKGAEAVAPAVHELLRQGTSVDLATLALATLGQIGARASTPSIQPYAHHRNAELRKSALAALGRTGGAGVVATLREALSDPDPGVRGIAASGLGAQKGREAIGDLFIALDHQVSEAAASIGQLCVKDECEKFVGRTGAIGLDVMTSGFDQILFRPASEIADDDKVKVVGRVRDLLTQEAANYLRDLQSRWPKDGSVRVKQAIDQAVTATAGIK
ncbi:MAG TPA: HEAT repeat domain-containing protein [Polyangiaceae bacterium]|nr:HEAT repeat domain-containing protein [Polyangiaceae bacterium]